jgi:hypothetical protein
VTLLDPAAKLQPQGRRSPRLVKRSHRPGGVVVQQHVLARAWEQREVDVGHRRIARTVIGGLAAVEEPPRVLWHDRRLRDELGERQLAQIAAEGGYVMIAGGLLDDHRQPQTSLAAESVQQPPVLCGAALGGGDQLPLDPPLRAQPDPGERLELSRIAGCSVTKPLPECLQDVACDPRATAPWRWIDNEHAPAEIVQPLDRRRARRRLLGVRDLHPCAHAAGSIAPPACNSSTARAIGSVSIGLFCSWQNASALWVKLAHSRKHPCA